MIQIIGRFHPLILHLPIGILVLAFIMEWLSRKAKFAHLKLAVGISLHIGMWSAILAAISGYILSWEGGYEETLVNRHQWLGIATACSSIALVILHINRVKRIGKLLYFPTFIGLMIILMITGHLGGSLTHGSDFLSAPLTQEKEEAKSFSPVDRNNALIYQDVIFPIFKQKCTRCHNTSKRKGKLLMSTIDGLKKGGENGPFFISGNVSESLFLQRIHLPLDDKEHMPPKGKNQLTKKDIALLEWWIEEGAPFDKKLNEVESSENIKSILSEKFPDNSDVFAQPISQADEQDIIKIKENGINIQKLSEDLPFLTANLSHKKNLSKKTFQQLDKISDQLIEIDLNSSNINDELLRSLSNFPHLCKISLQKTEITNDGLIALEQLKFLQHLNLYKTNISNEAVESLSKMPQLRHLYVWETNFTDIGKLELLEKRPMIDVNTGVSIEIFGKSTLSPPEIIPQNELFIDSTLIELQSSFKDVNIYYTLDGTKPDSNSIKYISPFYIKNSREIQSLAMKENWISSDISSKTIAKARYKISKIELSSEPNEKYSANGPTSLIDLKKGKNDFNDGSWIGYQGRNFSVMLDLENKKPISSISIGSIEDTNSWIFYPKSIQISISTDGKNYQRIAQKSIPTALEPSASNTRNFIVNLLNEVNTRFIKVDVKSNLKNPSWHPNHDEPCWVFIDEIMIE